MAVSNKLPPPPTAIPFMNGNTISQEWLVWFQRVYDSVLVLQNAP